MENRLALVTGAAGGIGAAVARVLGEQGTAVAAVDRDAAQLGEMIEKLGADGLPVAPFPADVTDSRAVDEVVAEIEARLGPIDFLVNAAGVLRLGEVSTFSDDDWNSTFAVNTTGVFHLSRAVVARMVPRGRGAVVTVASNAAATPRTGMAAYAASKAAAEMFTKSLGLEVARHGIRCNIVAPGSTDTPMLSSMWQDESGPRATVAGNLDAFRVGIPLGKLAQPGDVARAVAFLLSDQASHITLHTLTVDGGAALGA
ncbi:2,3-dihydro-2,3-dihydroxybenzoate dehydrogenase [Streptomyces europaeiscabiei]|uniref:2,3-dihydro-2,3-dihydroxybenzoate dehydrogenase n=1 Tax=Streptomyces europaeiscabiei TaxID=146819 RepID=A0ABU4NV89_9ACTN|nr:2,3-dihydro-2,3-dihydroxybenzoate dehydrogenase [Streptomyces europaeiscabiei]MDX2531209.1 2,3-dihydro-2,3-dihydroxybenzoate dehydrogenase [Streptomyces europaeiscabiei]MDX2759768.1 2,3-dihydro-2,3-dihydroxybenzoate dehydrogenase [Streptomyces europaeiscabiei]MDX2771167.1 2,3-dihydro-2,3-dihydroxybenzoate dehydrogenase [Streptomyces europaeiscabiei]MDX3549606.1 2,3-dihydro-2,3-dihydroxybenzoate dehydrogenase [Streptomyces europaeiscabiei]MDX3558951.1 2,3-dihydro-2,3-dihydroxybenzoate dehydr